MIAAQTERDAQRFIELGMPESRMHVTGNLKFDISVPASIAEQAQSLKRYLSVNRPVWIAASTQEGEEEFILEAHRQVLVQYSNAILILAPRHPDRIARVAGLCDKYGLRYLKRTDHSDFQENYPVYLLDTLGELHLHYLASQVAFVGGSLVNTGGQNMMEPAGLGLPVLSGPHTYNFTEVTELLLQPGSLIIVNNAAELAQQVCLLLGDANLRHNLGMKGKAVINHNKGNIDRLLQLISPYLSA